jgi:hypothetical protein
VNEPGESRTTFDPDMLRVLAVAFDAAWDAVPNHFRNPDRLRQVLATQIFEAAARGEIDPRRICEAALTRTFAGCPPVRFAG